jgi:hypothetical protein
MKKSGFLILTPGVLSLALAAFFLVFPGFAAFVLIAGLALFGVAYCLWASERLQNAFEQERSRSVIPFGRSERSPGRALSRGRP